MKLKLVCAFLIICVIQFSLCDIPTHCKKGQVTGKWTFKATKSQTVDKDSMYTFTCGHKNPSMTANAYLATIDESLFVEEFTVDLDDSDKATITSGANSNTKGSWTMIYDEGFDVRFNNGKINKKSFFAFLKYGPNDNKNPNIHSQYASYCFETLIGWYKDGEKRGCFKAFKQVENHAVATNGEVTDKQNVTEDSKITTSAGRFVEKNDEFLNFNSETRFMQSKSKFATQLQLTSEFKDHAQFVERINNSNLSWKAEVYDMFENKSIEQMNKMAGRKKSLYKAKNSLLNAVQRVSKGQMKAVKVEAEAEVENNNNAALLASLNYSNIMPTPRSQVNFDFNL